METIAIFASGNGSNAEHIVLHLRQHPHIQVALIATDNPHAGVIQRAQKLEIPLWIFNRADLLNTEHTLDTLQQYHISHIVLAGYLGLIPEGLINAFPLKIINIHPGLLPDFGGKGMYGDRVHQRVLDTHQSQSGITIHLIDAEYDRGQKICEVRLAVHPDDTVDTLAQRIHRLEHFYYPRVIEEFLSR